MIQIEIPAPAAADESSCTTSYKCKDMVNYSEQCTVIDTSVVTSFKDLIQLYKKQLETEDRQVISGGMQQYLNRHPEMTKNVAVATTVEQPILDSQLAPFNNLPIYIKLQIFSFLEVKDLCRISSVSREWHMLSCDDILWQNRLKQDIKKWHVISHVTNPSLYKELESDWTTKEIYLRCSPEINTFRRQRHYYLHNLTSILRSLLWHQPPLVAMFGPALDSSTHKLMGKLMWDKSGAFKVVGMFPGQAGGLGSGITLQVKGKQMNLSALYTTTKNERENQAANQRMAHNRLVNQKNLQNVEDGDTNGTYELAVGVKHLCATVDAFVFVVDVTQGNNTLSSDKEELFAMVSERWSAPHVPVTVLALVKDEQTKRMPCIDVVTQLELNKLNRPWQVMNCDSETLGGIPDSLEWLLEQAQRK